MKFDIEAYCKDNLDAARLNASNQIIAVCPWCGKGEHFYVDNDKGHYICFKCDERGKHLIGLVAHVEGITRIEATSFILRKSVQFQRKETTQTLLQKIKSLRQGSEIDEDEKVDIQLPPEFIPVWKDGKWKFPSYLKQRGIKRATARAWNIGWARRGRYGGRVIMPIVCPNGRSLTARGTTKDEVPKYLNPQGAQHARLLFGWNMVNKYSDVTLVEGPIDAIKMNQYGIPAMAVLGKVLHSEQLAMLMEKPIDSAITVMLDPEEATAPLAMARQLLCRFEHVYIAKLPDGIDPGDATQAQAQAALDTATAYEGDRIGLVNQSIMASRKKLSKIYQ